MSNRGQQDTFANEGISTEELSIVKNLLNTLLKAKKAIKIYPSNNPVYISMINEFLSRSIDFFQYSDELKLTISQDQIYYESEIVYENRGKVDNLALLFFKDGIQELSFHRELSYEELEQFLKIIVIDFDKEALDDDIVTMFWEMDFHAIHYVVDENYLADENDYESTALRSLDEKPSTPGNYQNARDKFILQGEDIMNIPMDILTDDNVKTVLEELEKDNSCKSAKIVSILFEVLYETDEEDDYISLSNYFTVVTEYLIKNGSFHEIVNMQVKLHDILKTTGNAKKDCAEFILKLMGSYEMLKLIGSSMDDDHIIDKDVFDKYIKLLDTSSIIPLMNILAELQTIHARKMFIDALVFSAESNPVVLNEGLYDERWYVVRNTIHIMRKIGCPDVMSHIMLTVKHSDKRVRKESIRFIGEYGSDSVVDLLQRLLQDQDASVRNEALRALGRIGSSKASRAIVEEISGKHFNEKPFSEKKSYFEVLAIWQSSDINGFLAEILKRKSLLKGTKFYELKTCAVYCLGLMGTRSALPLLDPFNSNENKLLREHTISAIKRIENE